MTQDKEWLQLYFIPTRDCNFLPKDTVCFTYIKTLSLKRLEESLIRLAVNREENATEGLFDISFVEERSDKGVYYSVKFEYRDRKGDEEFEQLIEIANFLSQEPRLEDFDGTRDMVRISDLTQEEYREMLQEARERRRTEG